MKKTGGRKSRWTVPLKHIHRIYNKERERERERVAYIAGKGMFARGQPTPVHIGN